MGKITALRMNKGRGQLVSVYVDGSLAFSVGKAIAAREGLRPEQELSEDRIEALTRRDRYERCLAAATGYLALRPRSLSELKIRLKRHGFDAETLDSVTGTLKAQGLLDDAAFARFWTDNRQSFSPRSRRMTRIELQRKGVTRDIVDDAVSAIDDEESAYRAAAGRLRSLRNADYEQFLRRLGSYLARRGFGYDVIRRTVERAWKEAEHQETFPANGNAGRIEHTTFNLTEGR